MIHLRYIFTAILMLFLVIFEDDKSGNFLRGAKSFRTLKHTKSRQSTTNDATSKYHLHHFGTSQKVKTDIFVNVIYKLIYLLLKIQEIFPSGLANLVNKLEHAHSFVYQICNSLGNISCILNQRWINLYVSHCLGTSLKNVSFNIGIKHVFPCINIRWVPREVFNIARGTQRMLMHGKTCSIAIIA